MTHVPIEAPKKEIVGMNNVITQPQLLIDRKLVLFLNEIACL